MLNNQKFSENYIAFLQEIENFDFSVTRNRKFAEDIQLERWAVMGCIRDYSLVAKFEITTKDFTNVCCRYLLKYAERVHKLEEEEGLNKQILESMIMSDSCFKQEIEKEYESLDRLVSFYNSLSLTHAQIYTRKFRVLSLIRQTEKLNNNSLAELYDLGTLIPDKQYLGEPIDDLSVDEIVDYISSNRNMDITPFLESNFCRNSENLYVPGRDPYGTYKDFFGNLLKENPEADMAAPHGCDMYNAITGGAEKGKLHLLAMPTNTGKTTMMVYHAASLAYNIKYSRRIKDFEERKIIPKKCLFLTTEQKTSEITVLVLAHLSGVNRATVELIKKGIVDNCQEDEIFRVAKAIEIMESGGLVIENVENLTPSEIIKKIRAYKKDKEIEYVFFDYIQVTNGLLKEYGSRAADHVALTLFANDLRNLAQAEKIFIEAAAQTSPSSTRQSTRLDGTCLKGSTGISDKVDLGLSFVIIKEPNEFDLEVISEYNTGNLKPIMKSLVWKNRTNHHKDEYMYLLADFGTCNFKVQFVVSEDKREVDFASHELTIYNKCAEKEYLKAKEAENSLTLEEQVLQGEIKGAQKKILTETEQLEINASNDSFTKRKQTVEDTLTTLIQEKDNIEEIEEEKLEHCVGEVFDEKVLALEDYKLQKLKDFFKTPEMAYSTIDFQELRENIPHEFIYNWLEEHNAEPTWAEDNGVEVINSITICHGGTSRKLKYYTNSNLFKCFTGCEEDYFDIFELICKVEGCGLKDAIKVVQDYLEDREIGIVQRSEIQKEILAREVLEEESEKDFIAPGKEISDETLNTKEIPKHIYPWEAEGITPEAFEYYNIRIDRDKGSIILPAYDIDCKLIGIRERSTRKEDIERYGKYHPVYWGDGINYRHSLSSHLFGLNWNKHRISQIHTAIIFEAEKSVYKMGCIYGFDKNCSVATCGSSISRTHIELLCNLGVNEIVIAFDRDYEDFEEVTFVKYAKRAIETAKLVKGRAKVTFLVDTRFKLPHKSSPIDQGRLIFEELLDKRIEVKSHTTTQDIIKNLHMPIQQTTEHSDEKIYRIYKGEVYDSATEFIERDETIKFAELYKRNNKQDLLPELSSVLLDEQALQELYQKNKALGLYDLLKYAKTKILQKKSKQDKKTEEKQSRKPLVGKGYNKADQSTTSERASPLIDDFEIFSEEDDGLEFFTEEIYDLLKED